jgi:hypothetical protein
MSNSRKNNFNGSIHLSPASDKFFFSLEKAKEGILAGIWKTLANLFSERRNYPLI